MSWLGHLLAGAPGPMDDYWYQPVNGVTTAAGIRVDADGAKKMSAWFRGRDILATALAMLPLPMWKRLPNDQGRDVAVSHPIYDLLHRKPNAWQDAFGWKRQLMYHLIDYGNGYCRIVPGARGFVHELWPIHPTLVTPVQSDSGRVLYRIKDPKTGQTSTSTQDEIFHLRGASDDGIVGKGVLECARESLGLGLVLESYASRLFSQGNTHGGHIELPGPMPKEGADALAAGFIAGLQNFHKPKVLAFGAKYVANTLDPEKAQMILSRKFSVNDVARWLGLPPHMLGDLDRATFSNIEQQSQEFVDYSLGPWLSLWEFAINDQLVLVPDTYYAEFVRDALVRGDIATRWQTYVAGVNAGILAPNEPRVKENLKKFDGGDVPRTPANITGNQADTTPATPPKSAPADANAKATAIVQESAARVLRKEITAVQKMAVKHAADADAFACAVTDFYAAHVALVSDTLQMPQADAERYCAGQAAQVVEGQWLAALEQWKSPDYAVGLAALALEDVA